MEALEVFLRVLRHRLIEKHSKNISFIPRRYTEPNAKFPAIKTHRLEIWNIDDSNNRTRIILAQITSRSVDKDEYAHIDEQLQEEVIKKLLEYYGI